MLEYLGGRGVAEATAQYLTAGDTLASHHREPQPVERLEEFWEQGLDISRSLWDRKSLLVHLDIEYVNFDFPAEPYVEAERIFELQRPIEWAIEGLLLDFDLRPLHLLSGRGHHFIWRVRHGSSAFKQLAKLGHEPAVLAGFNGQPHPPHGQHITPRLGAAYAGLGLVMEFLAHRIKALAAPMCELPVRLTAVEVPPSKHGREMISIDISEYGDPLSSRVIRVPFSLYLKPWQQRGLLGEALVRRMPPVFLIPLHEMDSNRGVQVMHSINSVVALAEASSTQIPDQSLAMRNLICAYLESPLAAVHKSFYAQDHHPPELWPETYDLIPMDMLPACASYALQNPNDLLLKPAGMERVVRVLMALGWHPRHIAGLIRSRFERDFHWGDLWDGYVPALRADFYTRLFAGQIATGLDNLHDFSCPFAQEQKTCFAMNCHDNLERFQKSLLERKIYERLACRPFNRLFLPAEHL